MFFRDKFSRIHRNEIIGETSRSWLSGYRWDLYKWAKRDFVPVCELDYMEFNWVQINKHKIIQKFQWPEQPYTVWKQIAELVGYVAEPSGEIK